MSARLLTIILAACILLLPGLGRPFFTRGEPREAIVAQDMLRSGDYILPSGYGNDVPSKPPFLHWLIVGTASLTGTLGEFESRFPSVAASILFAICFFLFLRRRVSEERAFASTLILLTSFEWLRASSAARVDLVLSASLAGGLLSLFDWYERNTRGIPWFAVMLLVCATLAKGPVGIVLPCGIFGVWLILTRELRTGPVVRLGMVATISGAIAALWYLAAYFNAGNSFVEMMYDENVRRFAGTMEGAPHEHGVWYHPVMLFLGLLPWTLLLFSLERPTVSKIRDWFHSLLPLERYSVVAGSIFLLFFSIPESKRSVYLLPAYPFFAVLLSQLAVRAIPRAERVCRGIAALSLAFVGFGCLFVLFPGAIPLSSIGIKEGDVALIQQISQSAWSSLGREGILLFLPLVVGIFWLVGGGRILASWRAVVGVVLVLSFTLNNTVMNWVARGLSGESFAQVLLDQIPANQTVYSFDDAFYDLAFYMNRKIYLLEDRASNPELVLVVEKEIPEFQREFPGEVVQSVARSSTPLNKPGRYVMLVRRGAVAEE